jgi:hypothetical protein
MIEAIKKNIWPILFGVFVLNAFGFLAYGVGKNNGQSDCHNNMPTCDCLALEQDNAVCYDELAREKQKNLDLKSQKYILLKRSEYQKLDSVLVQEVMLLAKEVQKDSVQANTLIRYGEAVGKRKVVSFILGSQ